MVLACGSNGPVALKLFGNQITELADLIEQAMELV